MTDDTLCTQCGGSGKVLAFINRGADISRHSLESIACRLCGGTGKVSAEKLQMKEAGELWYQKEAGKDGTILDVANRLGLSMSEVSAIRHGRKPPPNSPEDKT